MKYEYGVGTQKWELEAKNDDIAYITMVMAIGNSGIPIAVYSQGKCIDSKNVLDMDDLNGFMEKNIEELRKANKSIKIISN